ncbi:hypothetical protein H7H82_02995 [Mycobacterium heidelbergense]|uniref:Uncharacterized protein n=1 Tax=Mycobacterium heidelbergense TaxID=53376 RepID=A0A1X0DNF9_MYCHE|nr:DUF5994 family protein [Mycobacterium heidelbergense]MCV7049581.1 hypothetical protein [Mycobacterium heidelbergense]ORA73926.1 hypothetical protein BST25_11045 [Mycobacterium heidelbergense]BBZ52712.1 hypothetical protein MHEI_44290 [Mycobacterium heidelbergense]
MTLLQDHGSTRSDSHPAPRLRLKPKAPATGYVDGAWWPRSHELVNELPDLLAVLSVRLGAIGRVIYNLNEWTKTPPKFSTGGVVIRLDGYTRQPVDTLEIIGLNRSKIYLLVVPSDADSSRAHHAMMSAATPDDASTIVELLHHNPR